jgi:hypothetical protein
MSTDKDNRDRESLLDFILNSVPRIEASPFFAARVANIAQVERYSFAGSLQTFSRRLVPLFVTLIVVTCLGAYRLTVPDPLVESAMFYDEEHLVETISVEHVVDSLILFPIEENEDH